MRALPVNFVSRRKWQTLASSLVFVAASTIAAVQGWRAWQAHTTTKFLQLQMAAQAPIAAASARRADTKDLLAAEPFYAADANIVVQLASYNVAAVLENIEAAKVPGVRVVSIEIAAAAKSTRIEIEAPDHQAASRYVLMLNQATEHLRWDLIQTQRQNSGVTAKIISTAL